MTIECETHHVKVSKLRLLKKSYDDNQYDSSKVDNSTKSAYKDNEDDIRYLSYSKQVLH